MALYHYKCEIVKCVDGDTIDCIPSLGFGVHLHGNNNLLLNDYNHFLLLIDNLLLVNNGDIHLNNIDNLLLFTLLA